MASKYFVVKFSDGNVYSIPAKSIAGHRAHYYATLDSKHGLDFQAIYDTEVDFALKYTNEILDWAANNMNWSDVRDVAQLLRHDTLPTDYETEWSSANTWIEGE